MKKRVVYIMKIKEKGFTLIEVVAALLILSMAILLFSNFFVHGYGLSKKQDNQMIAMNLARQVAEEWRSGNGRVLADGQTTPSGRAVSPTSLFTYNELVTLRGETIPLTTGHPIMINGRSYTEEVFVQDLAGDNPDIATNSADMVLVLTVIIRDARTHETAATLHTSITAAEEGS